LKWINENDIVKIKVGDEANVEVDAYFKKEVQRSGYEYFKFRSSTLTLTSN
jgi:HlyD family secretion protein